MAEEMALKKQMSFGADNNFTRVNRSNTMIEQQARGENSFMRFKKKVTRQQTVDTASNNLNHTIFDIGRAAISWKKPL